MVRLSRVVSYISLLLLCSFSVLQLDSRAQDKSAQPQAKLSHLGPGTVQFYSWFAETVLKLSESGDTDGAGRVARLMEMSWDREGDRYTNQLWSKIDQASDELVQPVEYGSELNHIPTHATDVTKVRAAYQKYIGVLKEESEPSK